MNAMVDIETKSPRAVEIRGGALVRARRKLTLRSHATLKRMGENAGGPAAGHISYGHLAPERAQSVPGNGEAHPNADGVL